jgi:hypothetical protein
MKIERETRISGHKALNSIEKRKHLSDGKCFFLFYGIERDRIPEGEK